MSSVNPGGKFLETLAGTRHPTPPIWLMRQAGRYLPEYRAVRSTTKSFLEFCYTPDKAVEVTLQPIRRFGFDAAIIFSDILVVPDALGQKVWFEEGEGPKLEALTDPSQFGRLSRARLQEHLAPVYEAIRRTRAELPKGTTLLGFAGAPFTLACYMIEGSGSKDFAKVKKWAYAHPESFRLLIDLLVEAVVDQAMSVLAVHFHSKSEQWPGRQHQLDEGYFDRIDAMHYTLAHDDGQSTHDLEDADVILVGPSRTSKTPTCVYLANRGVRAANVPLVPQVPPPSELEDAKRPLIVGLITDPDRLVQIRVNRLRLLQQDTESEYTDMETVQKEIQEARRLYARRKWATIDVTRRSIEETAAAILQMLATRREQRLQTP